MSKNKKKARCSPEVRLSKSLSWLLRHGADSQGLQLDGCYADVQAILRLKQFSCYTVDDIRRIVETNDKKRFSLREKDGWLQIRANQGHTLPVSEENLLEQLSLETIPSIVVHGTNLRNWEKIKAEGLSRMKRNHIHFAAGFPDDSSVISGMRKNSEVHILIDTKKAFDNEIKFYRSENGVILSPGDESGFIKPCYFKEVWQIKPKQLIFKND